MVCLLRGSVQALRGFPHPVFGLILCPILFHIDRLSLEIVGSGGGVHPTIVGARVGISKYVRDICSNTFSEVFAL